MLGWHSAPHVPKGEAGHKQSTTGTQQQGEQMDPTGLAQMGMRIAVGHPWDARDSRGWGQSVALGAAHVQSSRCVAWCRCAE